MKNRLEQLLQYFEIERIQTLSRIESARGQGDKVVIAYHEKSLQTVDSTLRNLRWLSEESSTSEGDKVDTSKLRELVELSRLSQDLEIRKGVLEFLDSDQGHRLSLYHSINEELLLLLRSHDPRKQLDKVSSLLNVLTHVQSTPKLSETTPNLFETTVVDFSKSGE